MEAAAAKAWIIIINSFFIFIILFFQGYRGTSFEKFTTSALVANRRVKYTIWDTTGMHQSSSFKVCQSRKVYVTSFMDGP